MQSLTSVYRPRTSVLQRSYVENVRRKKQRVVSWMKLAKGSAMSDASAEVEVLLVVVVTGVPHLPHHAEIPTDAHHPHPADAYETTILTEEVALDDAITLLLVVVVVDV